MKRFIRHYPKVQEMLQFATDCAVCGQSFLNTWLECVHFVDARKVRKNPFIFLEITPFKFQEVPTVWILGAAQRN